MEYLKNAAQSLQQGTPIKAVIAASLEWLEGRAKVDRKLLDKLLRISAVVHLMDEDVRNGLIQENRRQKEHAYWTGLAIQALAPGTEDAQKQVYPMLFVAANPMGSIVANLDEQALIQPAEELKDIESSIRHHQMLNALPIKTLFEASLTELAETLNTGNYQILHFSNHGREDGIILNKGDGEIEHVTIDQLSRLLELTRDTNDFQLIFLNACNSQSIAKAIHQKHSILNIIAHEGEIPAIVAREFAAYFYRILAQNLKSQNTADPFKDAFELAINQFPKLRKRTGFFPSKEEAV